MSKPRIAIPMIVKFQIRCLLRTGLLERISAYAQPVVLPRWRDDELWRELEQAGAEVHLLPDTVFDRRYTRLRRQIDLWHAARGQSPSVAIDRRRARALTPPLAHLKPAARDLYLSARLQMPGEPERLLRLERAAAREHTNMDEFAALFERIKPDAVFSQTPYFRYEQLFLRVAAEARTPLCTAIMSFDNLTTRGWLPVVFDSYLLWNRYNEAELRRMVPEAAASPVTLVGAPQFDFYRDAGYVWDEARWRESLGLPPGRPVVLFGGGMVNIAPHEPHWLTQLDDAIDSGEIPDGPVILLRRHPNDPAERWLPVLRQARHVVHDPAWLAGESHVEFANVRRYDIEQQVSTLAHSAVHVNASSTMTIDGAFFDRPQVGPAYDDRPGRRYDRLVKELYLREHFLPITRSGGLEIAYSRDALVAAVRDGLEHPARRAEERRRMVREICTFTDGRSAERVSEALRSFLGLHVTDVAAES